MNSFMLVNKNIKTNISELYIAGSSNLRPFSLKTGSLDLKDIKRASNTPDLKQSSYNKWSLKGHKFITIYNKKRPKKRNNPQLSLIGVSYIQTKEPNYRNFDLVRYKNKNTSKNTDYGRSVSTSLNHPILCDKTLRKSSKSFQVNTEHLSSWMIL